MWLFVLLIEFIFSFYVYVLLIRLIVQKQGASWHNPIVQWIVKITNPAIKPLKRFIPGFKGFDLAIVVALFVVEVIGIVLLLAIKVRVTPGLFGSMVVAIAQIGSKVMNLYFYGIIISVVMGWVPSLKHNPLAAVVDMIAEPLLRLGRRYIPSLGGIDLSPIPLLLALQLLKIFIFSPLFIYGFRLAY